LYIQGDEVAAVYELMVRGVYRFCRVAGVMWCGKGLVCLGEGLVLLLSYWRVWVGVLAQVVLLTWPVS
jgi:hypothetical protein